MQLEKIFSGIATESELDDLLTRYDPASRFSHLEFKPGQWFEISRADFFYFFGVLPPMGHTGGSFAMPEFTTGNITESFHKFGDRYFAMTISYRRPKDVADARLALQSEIEKQLDS